MHQFAQATAQAVANLAERIGMGELAEQHRDQLRPAREPFRATLGAVLLDECGKLSSGEMLEQLIKQAGYLYHCLALLVGDVWRSSGPGTIRQRSL